MRMGSRFRRTQIPAAGAIPPPFVHAGPCLRIGNQEAWFPRKKMGRLRQPYELLAWPRNPNVRSRSALTLLRLRAAARKAAPAYSLLATAISLNQKLSSPPARCPRREPTPGVEIRRQAKTH